MFGLKKIISAPQTKQVDLFTIRNESTTSIDLMERASKAFTQEFLKEDLKGKKIAVVCGVGNNGGDGLAVARILVSKGYKVTPFLIQFKETMSNDCQTNLERLKDVIIIKSEDKIPELSSFDIIIDALLGTGLKKGLKGFLAQVVNAINASKSKIYSIDIPSGLFCDEIINASAIIKSHMTISFQRPKMAFFFPENNDYIQWWKVVDIGLNEGFIQRQESRQYLLDKEISHILKRRKRYSHKGSYGHALMIVGSYGMMGAGILASKACLRSGVGLLTSYVPRCGYEILQASVPEAMCITDEKDEYISSLPNIKKFDAIGIGPGLGTNSNTANVLLNLFKEASVSLVLDADALNILSANLDLISKIPENTILTPHIKEFDKLVGTSKNSNERFEKQRHFSIKNRCIVVLKDAHTSVSDCKGNLYFNTSGNPGMATGGSGDVLTGVITGLLAQRYCSIEAALMGTYYHGYAGDTAAKEKGQRSMVASDIIECIKISAL